MTVIPRSSGQWKRMARSEPPFFETDEERSYMTVILPVHKRFMAAADSEPEKSSRKDGPD